MFINYITFYLKKIEKKRQTKKKKWISNAKTHHKLIKF